jgi:hypothetical protein
MMNKNLMGEGLEYCCNDAKDTDWKGLFTKTAFSITSAAAFALAYFGPSLNPQTETEIVIAGQKQSKKNVEVFISNGWEVYKTRSEALSLKKRSYNSTTKYDDLKKAWEGNLSNVRNLFPGVEQVIDLYLDGNKKK